jgi:hypothetical protein
MFSFCQKNYTTCFIDKCCGYDWGSCSKMHDRRYENKRLTRKQADELLYRCFKRQVNIVFAFIGYLLVRIFGGYFYKKAQKNMEKKMTHEELEKSFLDSEHKYLKLSNMLNDNMIDIRNNVLEVKHKQDKFTYILFGIVFLAGIMIGTQYKSWIPYLKDGYKVVKTISSSKGQ